MFGLILLCIIFLTFIASWFVSYESITTTNAYARYNPPSWQYPFGTDDMGRNLFLRVVYGARYSIVIGFGCTLISLVIGVGLGAAAGFYGGKLESIIMRAADVMISVPAILAAMVLMTALGQSLMNLIFAMGITGVPIYIRITRASVLSVRSNEYVEAARAIGLSNFRIIFSEVLPNGMSPVIITVTTGIGMTIMAAAGLSFIGLGVPPPQPEWGGLISAGRALTRTHPWVAAFPGIAIMIVVLGFNMLGDGLRDALDPKLKQTMTMLKKARRKNAKEPVFDGKKAPVRQPGSETLLDVKDLVVNYVLEDETVEAVNGISFSLKKGQTLGLVGETGAGKTSTALSILNLVQTPPGVIKNGTITVCGRDVLNMTKAQLAKIRGKDVSMIFQDPMTALNPVMTVGEQIAESIKYHEGLSHIQALQKAADMLELVGIPAERGRDYPHQFSGGMKQRVVIAIALACNPHVLLMDEPTTALDVTIQAQILDLMGDLQKKLDTAFLMITHDLGVVAKVCDTVAVVYAGKIVEYGTLEDVFTRTMHPYTEGLFTSLPNVKDKNAELIPIPGLMPDPTKLPAGCAFEPRCRYAVAGCREPCPVRSVSETHSVVCSRYDEPGFHIDMKRGGS
jgi:peptide/nickel transport system permease protein